MGFHERMIYTQVNELEIGNEKRVGRISIENVINSIGWKMIIDIIAKISFIPFWFITIVIDDRHIRAICVKTTKLRRIMIGNQFLLLTR